MNERHIAILSSNHVSYDLALLYVSGGHKVTILTSDTTEALTYIGQRLDKFVQQDVLKGNLSKQQQLELISFSSHLTDAVLGATIVQECLTDDLDIRTSMLRSLDKLVGDDVIMISCNTSLMPSKLSECLSHRKNFVVVNHIEPLYFLPAMEVVPAPWTDAAVVESCSRFFKQLGQKPAILKKEVPGFLINRVQSMLYREAYRLVHDGVITGEECDILMTEGIGLRYALMGGWEAVYLDCTGMYSLVERYGDMVYDTQKDLRPAVLMGGETLHSIEKSVQRVAGGVEKISDRRHKMEDKIAALDKLKRDMDKQHT